MLAFAMPAKNWLWTAALTPGTRRVVADRPLHPVRHEIIDGVHTGIVETDLPEGTVLLTTQAGVSERFGTAYVVLADVLQHVHEHEAQDILDPAEATQRLHERLRQQAGLDDVSRRIRFPDGHAMTKGEFRAWGVWYAVVTDVTPRQVWVRAATTAEILAGGGVVLTAPVGQALIDGIRAEVAETEAEAA
ncbi:hypothetical protein [Methylobacterium brachiatum]|jgi:hypothetical protein|uniref:hypothetical protein n=1 Tax=Methylobacterium brachiatum TaxID=269660 RepID=UPI000EFA6AC3|nr:hypothetical protein [Methylobacterium brachiatum]AYO83126.1 hypothetical protein EBB05_13210 [Methylobacterium brachiatum]